MYGLGVIGEGELRGNRLTQVHLENWPLNDVCVCVCVLLISHSIRHFKTMTCGTLLSYIAVSVQSDVILPELQ